MGRSVANEGFLTALLHANPYDGYHFFLAGEGACAGLEAILAERFPALHAKGAFVVATRHALPEALAANSYHAFHLSDCISDFASLVRLRNAVSQHVFPVTGTTHSLSYARYSPHFFDQIWSGVTDRDAVIATSRAGFEAVRAMYDALRAGYGLGEEWKTPRLERIPLGISSGDFPTEAEKPLLAGPLRASLGIEENCLVLLVFARISHYGKMDILPLLRALVRAEGMGLAKERYVVVLAGWADTGSDAANAYAELAARLGIRLHLVLSPDNARRKALFAAADIFVSPVDNPQETFGLTILEAGASGLPVVASDFDGYRDLVVQGETGFLVPTLGPDATPESDALAGVWFDNQHHLQLAQQSVVDVPELAVAIAALASNPNMRRSMGEKARCRVQETYGWSHVVAAHVTLWEQLASVPVEAPPARHPLHPGYPAVFGAYYSRLLDDALRRSLRVRWSRAGEAVYRGREFPVLYAGIERLVSLESLRKLLFTARKPVSVAELVPPRGANASAPDEHAAFLVLWALKHDYLERVREGDAPGGPA